MLEIFSLIFLLSSLAVGFTKTEANKKWHTGIKSSKALKYWDDKPDNFKDSDFSPPIIGLNAGVVSPKKSYNLMTDFDMDFKAIDEFFVSTDTRIEKQIFMENLKGQFGLESTLAFIATDSIYSKTAIENNSLGIIFALKYQYKFSEFYLDFKFRYPAQATVAKSEGIETRSEHATDFYFNTGVITQYEKYLGALEIAFFDFGETKILSKEFSYRISQSSITRFMIGGGYVFNKTHLWLKYYQYTKPEDELSHFYQAPYFEPEYTLAKEFITLEAKWYF